MVEAPRTGVNASHFGIQVASSEDVAAAWTRFKEAGLTTEDRREHVVLLRASGQGLGRGSGRQRLGGLRRQRGHRADEREPATSGAACCVSAAERKATSLVTA